MMVEGKELRIATVEVLNDLIEIVEGDIDLCVFNFPDVLSVNIQSISEFLLR